MAFEFWGFRPTLSSHHAKLYNVCVDRNDATSAPFIPVLAGLEHHHVYVAIASMGECDFAQCRLQILAITLRILKKPSRLPVRDLG